MERNIAIGVLISGSGTNLKAIGDACGQGRINGRVAVVGSDNPRARGLQWARELKIPAFVVDYGKMIRDYRLSRQTPALPPDFDLSRVAAKQNLRPQEDPRKADFLKTRAMAEARLLAALAPYNLDLLVLAGFMRTLTPYFIDRFNVDPARPRIMNIHPALLPAFPGVDGYGDTFRYGCKVAGCTVHFIDYGEDTGPIIAQRAFPIEDQDTLETVRQKGLAQEWALYPHCIQLFAQGRLRVVAPAPSDIALRPTVALDPNPIG